MNADISLFLYVGLPLICISSTLGQIRTALIAINNTLYMKERD